MADFEEAIRLGREALNATPEDNPDRATYLNNLGLQFSGRHSRLGTLSDLEEAIRLGQCYEIWLSARRGNIDVSEGLYESYTCTYCLSVLNQVQELAHSVNVYLVLSILCQLPLTNRRFRYIGYEPGQLEILCLTPTIASDSFLSLKVSDLEILSYDNAETSFTVM